MRFWDSSVFVALLVEEQGSKRATKWLQDDDDTWAWTLSIVEVISALERRAREQLIAPKDLTVALSAMHRVWRGVSLVRDVDSVKARAMRLLANHPLRAADACQLAAALVAVEERPRDHDFHTFDARLSEAARREGFVVHDLDESP